MLGLPTICCRAKYAGFLYFDLHIQNARWSFIGGDFLAAGPRHYVCAERDITSHYFSRRAVFRMLKTNIAHLIGTIRRSDFFSHIIVYSHRLIYIFTCWYELLPVYFMISVPILTLI